MMKLTVIGVVLAIGLVVAFGLYLFGIGLRNVGRAVASSRWPRTAGKVVRSDTKAQRDVDKKTRDVSVIYSADTVLQYEVAGKRYGSRPFEGRPSCTLQHRQIGEDDRGTMVACGLEAAEVSRGDVDPTCKAGC
jgi:hypothetical protein